jgi:hypothetical protein
MGVRMDVREGHRRRSAGPSPAAGRGQEPATAGPARSLRRPAEWEGLGGTFPAAAAATEPPGAAPRSAPPGSGE